ncbi:flagellar basal body rod C-terminal domain-containing protein [Geminicoccaceae bacterium 1502E]|nr:flagellar basal body rod C-terminal domain-containing protein [Geminicoccaceae bacterium 1502E]
MTLGNGLNAALSGLRAAQQALALTSGNIANAGTPGHARRLHAQEAVVAGTSGAGVRSLTPQRAVDDYLVRQSRMQEGALAHSGVLAELRTRLEQGVLATRSDGGDLAGRIASLAGRLETLAAAPADPVARSAALAGIIETGRGIDAGMAELRMLRGEMDARIGDSVGKINGALAALERLNGQIAQRGEDAGLADRRDTLLASLATEIDIAPFQRPDGTVAVFTGSGKILLDGQARQVHHAPVGTIAAETRFGEIAIYRRDQLDAGGVPRAGESGEVLVGAGLRAEPPPELAGAPEPLRILSSVRGGALAGFLEARDTALPALGDQLGELAAVLRHGLNAAHNASTALPPPARLEGSRSDFTGYDPGMAGGTARLAVVDQATGEVVRLLDLPLAGATPADLAATIDAGLAGIGRAALAPGGGLEIETTQPGLGLALDENDSRIPLADAAGHGWSYGFAHYFGLNDLVEPSSADGTGLRLRPDIAADANLLASARLSLLAGPPPGGSLGGAGDNRGAQALARALQTPLATVSRGGLAGQPATAGDYAARIQALATSAAAAAAQETDDHAAIAGALKERVASVSGVNIDEELGKLMLYQQAYVAAARVVSITSDLLDELGRMAR